MTDAASLSPTARALLTSAAEHQHRIAIAPKRLPVAAWRSVVQSLLKASLLEEVPAEGDQPIWRTLDDGAGLTLRASDAGLAAVGLAATEEQNTPTPSGATTSVESSMAVAPIQPSTLRRSLRSAADALIEAWDGDPAPDRPALTSAMAALRAALTPAGRSRAAMARQPRSNTKRATVLGLLRRPEGATIAQVVEATGWAQHTVRGCFAGLKKAGMPVEVLERVRQVGPGKEGAQGSYTVYHVAEVA